MLKSHHNQPFYSCPICNRYVVIEADCIMYVRLEITRADERPVRPRSESFCRFISGQRRLDADHLGCRAQTRGGDKSAAEQRS